MTDILYRAAHVSEATAIAGMSRLHIEYGLRWRWSPARVRRHIKNPETMVLIASRQGSMAGFAIMKFGDSNAHLLLLAVDPHVRRAGVGRGLINWLEKSCNTAGIRQIQVEVRSRNKIARRFYGALGFCYLGQIAGYYDRREAASIFGKSLVASRQPIGPPPG